MSRSQRDTPQGKALVLDLTLWRREELAEFNTSAQRLVEWTFATRLAANSESESQILNPTGNVYLRVVLLILTFADVAAEKGMRMLELDH
jgi:hypothetical protein